MGLSDLDKKIFTEKGVLHLKGLISKKAVATVQGKIISELTRLKVKSNGKIIASKLQSLPFFQQITSLSQMVKVGVEIEDLFSPELVEIIDSLSPEKLKPATKPQLLLSLPHKEDWTLQRLSWHLDITVTKKDELLGIQAFVLIDDVLPHGGATLALAGSHRLHYFGPSGNAHAVLRTDPNYAKLFDGSPVDEKAFAKPQTVNGFEVSLIEMCGKAGDVFLMDMRVLHAPSINDTKNIRMMTTNRWVKAP